MVTKLDVFIWLYEKGGPRKTIDIVKGLNQKSTEYDKIRKMLDALVNNRMIVKTEHNFEKITNNKNQHFFDMLKYCITNGVNYNDLFDETVAEYLSRAFSKKSFAAKDVKLHPRTFARVSQILEKNGFLIVLSRKPFKAVAPFNSFLRDLIAYYGHKSIIVRKQECDFLDEIKKELLKFNKLKAKNIREYQEILKSFQIKFIYHSLSIEGNPVTLPQTIKLLKDKVVPENLSVESVQEVQNYQRAFLQMLRNVEDDAPLTKESMLNYHFTAMQHKPKWAGKIRDDYVVIKGNKDFKLAKPEEIGHLLDNLINEYNDFIKRNHSLREVFDFAAYLHNEFQYIHPFFDGNSRTTRLITFQFLQMNGIPVFDIPLGVLEEYVGSTKGSKKRDEKELAQVLQKVVLYNLKAINERFS